MLIVLAAVLGYFNLRVLKLPSSIGLTIMGAVASLLVVGLDRLLPGSQAGEQVVGFIAGIDFHTTLIDGMLSFLLFAGALHMKWDDMRRGRWPILVLRTVGVVLSTTIIGFGFHVVVGWLGLAVPLIWCFVFGALNSPTDPVAVLGIVGRADVSPTPKATIAGESVFNDGVGVVVFASLLEAALGSEPLSLGRVPPLMPDAQRRRSSNVCDIQKSAQSRQGMSAAARTQMLCFPCPLSDFGHSFMPMAN